MSTPMIDLVERLALTHGDHVPLAELRRAAGMDERDFRAAVLAAAQAGRLLLHVELAPRLVDVDKLDRRWYVAGEGEVKFISLVADDDADGLALLGVDHEIGRSIRRITFLSDLHKKILPHHRRPRRDGDDKPPAA